MLDTVLIWIEKNKHRWLGDLKQWLAIPSVSAQSEHDADTAAAAEWAMLNLHGIGLEAKLVATPGHPCVLATTPPELAPADAVHVLLYGHYDVQPPEPLEPWQSKPFEPQVRDGKLFARGATDDKGQVHAHLAALLAWREIAQELPVRLTVLLEGEEEIGSPHLPQVLRDHADLLRTAQCVVISDCSQFAPGVPAITCGLRGLVYYEMEVCGPANDLHSGLFGGYVANPANALVAMLARLHDAQGRVCIPTFYDEVELPAESLRRQWATLPTDDAALARQLGVRELWGEAGFTNLERKWCRPTLDINGLTSGYQGAGAKTVLPARASAKLSMRIVPRQDPAKIGAALEAFVRQITPPGVTVSLTQLSAGPPAITPTDTPHMQAAAEAVEIGFGKKPVFIREGGSIPVVSWFKDLLGLESLLLGFGLPDDGAHGPNEKINLEDYYRGIKTAAALYEKLGALGR